MLTPPEFVLLALVALFLGLPVFWAWRLAFWYLFREASPPLADSELPSVAVILPLRGADPSLRACLRGLLNQDYPRYGVRIIIDSLVDPAWDVVPPILDEGHGANVDVRVGTLQRHCDTCTLKISAQMQVVSELEESVQVIAMIDADVVPAGNWLRTLVAPLADPRVGGATGVRWFAPAQPTWGALVRHLFNAGSQPQMHAFDIPWGGTLALRAGLFREGGLLAEWRQSFCDDSGAGDLLRRLGQELRFLPALTMVNSESIDLKGACRFVRRQLLCPRMDLGRWPAILGANLAQALATLVAAAMVLAGCYLGYGAWVAWFGGALVLHLAGMLSALRLGEYLIRRIVRRRGQQVPPEVRSWKLLPALLLTQVISWYYLIRAQFARRIRWRGIEYALGGPKRVRMGEYRPFQSARSQPHSDRSIV
jgi:Glycosyl transferase family 21